MNSRIIKKILSLFIPIFLELFLINLLTTVDTLMLGKYNELCVDAVGTANSTLSLLTIFIIISSNGVAITVGQYLGAGKNEDAKKVLSQGVLFNFILGIILMMIFLLGSDLLLKLVNTKEEFFEYSKQYITIFVIALPFQALNQVIIANFRAYGKPQYMTIVSIVANLINVLFNYLLIFGVGIFPELGIKGAAIATVISIIFKTVAGVILNHLLIKSHFFPRGINKEILKSIVKIGAPSAFESIFYTSAQFILVAALNRLSNDSITARIYINMTLAYIYMFSSAIASANSILVANYVGAHKYNEAKKLTLYTAIVGVVVIAILVSILWAISPWLFSLISDNANVVSLICMVIPLAYILELGRCINLVVINAQKSSGDVLFPLILGFVCMFLIAAGGSWLFTGVFGMGLAGIILAQGLDEFVRGIVSVIRWLSNKWQNKSLIKE